MTPVPISPIQSLEMESGGRGVSPGGCVPVKYSVDSFGGGSG